MWGAARHVNATVPGGAQSGSVGEAAMTRLCPVLAASFIISVLVLHVPVPSQAQIARDPGPRTGTPGAGKPLGDLTGPQMNLFNAGISEFKKRDQVKADGLGPRMKLDSCAGCHNYPDVGGTSPPDLNPQFDFFEKNLQKTNQLPRFVTRMARYARRGSSLILTSGPPTAASIRFSPLRDLRTDTPVTVGAMGLWVRRLSCAPPPGWLRRLHFVVHAPTSSFGLRVRSLHPAV